MPTDKKISQLSSGAPAQGTDETVIARGGANYKLTVAEVVGYLGSPVSVANGGTGQSTYTDGQLLIGNSSGNTLSKNTLTAGAGISITNGTGTITIAATTTDPIPSGSVMLFMQTAAPTGWTKSTAHDNKALRVVSGTASSGGSVGFTTAFASQAVNGTISSTTATNQATTATNQSTTATNQATTATNQATTQGGTVSTSVTGTVSTSVSGSVSGSVGNTTLGINEIPSHAHTMSFGTSVPVPNGSFHNVLANTGSLSTNANGGSGAHGHSWSGSWSGSASSSFSGSGSSSFTGSSHNHTQDSHNHTQNAHNHTQDAHNHTQDAHGHNFTGTAINLAVSYVDVIVATKN